MENRRETDRVYMWELDKESILLIDNSRVSCIIINISLGGILIDSSKLTVDEVKTLQPLGTTVNLFLYASDLSNKEIYKSGTVRRFDNESGEIAIEFDKKDDEVLKQYMMYLS